MRKFKLLFSILALTLYVQVNAQETSRLQHVLLFDWNDTATEEQKSEVLALFESLVTQLDGMYTSKVKEVVSSSGNFDIAIFMTFENEAALKEYEEHPDHLKIAKIAPPLLSGFSEFDFYGEL